MAKKTKDVKKILFLTLLILSGGCANQLPPSGGEVDKIPPEIISVYPSDGTTNFKDNRIVLTFSEYVDKRSVKDAFFISPTVEGEKEFDWSGTTLEIIFKDSLKRDITYSVTIGTDVKDINRGNKMARAFTFAFSTGKKIDKGVIRGKVFDKKPQGILIFAYKRNGEGKNPLKDKPDYISQVGNDGMFRLTGLAETSYKILAIRDRFGDFLYNVGEDEYGTPYKEISLSQKDSVIEDVNFLMTKEDTSAPHLNNVTMTDRNHILAEFSEPLDSSSFSSHSFYLYDSTSASEIPLPFIYKGNSKPTDYFFAFSDSLRQGNNYYFVAESIRDKYGNLNLREELGVAVNEKADTSVVAIKSVITDYSNKINPFDPKIFVRLTDAVDTTLAKNGIYFYDKDTLAQDFSVKFQDPANFVLKPFKIKSAAKYFVAMNLKYFRDVAGNGADTVIFRKLESMNKLDFTGAEGNVFSKEKGKIFVILQNTAGKNSYVTQANADGTFAFRSVLPGKYILHAFLDKNGNNRYDYGKVEPYVLSEKFAYYADTLRLRARWPVGNIELRIAD
jgi:hypothetical protein